MHVCNMYVHVYIYTCSCTCISILFLTGETHIDHVGRRYVLDHSTHTVNYEQTEEGVENVPDVSARREMLNRRYQSLHRSFRSAHRERRDPSSGLTTNLSPVESVGAISYIPIDANRRGSSPRGSLDNTSDDASGTSPSSFGTGYRNKKGKKPNKSGWFTFGRKSRTVVSESPNTSDIQDDSIPISGQIINHDMLFSPISPPPSLEELGISLPPPVGITTNHEGEIGRERRLDFPEESGLLVGGLEIDIDRETDSDAHTSVTTTAILAAINSEPHPQSHVNGDANEMGIETRNQRFSHVTDLDRAAAVIAQKKLRSTARRSSSQDQEGGDTDDETNVSPRSTSVTPVDMSHDQEQLSPDQEEEKDIDSKKGIFSRKLSKGLMECPALTFITRRDLYTFLSAAGVSCTCIYVCTFCMYMYVCMYVCIYIHVHVYIYIYIHVCMVYSMYYVHVCTCNVYNVYTVYVCIFCMYVCMVYV